ncbi:hypothetical protein C8039_02140 [Halogeometricum sp. wsp3]|nr:hypothetical protein C8039_02140 [Halogeometricum sp. wsp3]
MIRAVAQLNRRTDRPVELVICGDGPNDDGLNRWPRHLALHRGSLCGSGRAPGRLRYGEGR